MGYTFKDLEVAWGAGAHGAPWRVQGPAWRMTKLPVGAMGKHGVITEFTSDWARVGYEKVADFVTMICPRQSGHEIEGRVKIKGKTHSAFTSGGENPDGGRGMIIVREGVASRRRTRR